jgi:predicted GIY-YIG superfamily endonuclease
MCDWVCYLIMSLDSNDTYIGSSNNQPKRLNDHNNNNQSRRGAKRTRGQTWVPVIVISGFSSKNACLSFESGWKRLSKRRNNDRLEAINCLDNLNLRYRRNTKQNRILDLLYFVHNITMVDNKFRINYDLKHPIIPPTELTINIFLDEWIEDLPWPYFIRFVAVI